MKKKIEIKSIFNREKLSEYLSAQGLGENVEEIDAELIKVVDSKIKEKTKAKKNSNRIKANDATKEHASAKSRLTKEEIEALPKWVKDQIDTAQIIGTSGDLIQVEDGRKYHRKNKLNDLPGGQWTYFLNSVINTRFPTNGPEAYAHEIRKVHPSPKPPQLMRAIIEFFTKENELVFDYFMGVGGTLLGASLSNRRAIGIDLNQKFIDTYKEASKTLDLKLQTTIQGDSIKMLAEESELKKYLKDEMFSLILIDPPYGDMLAREKTGEAIKKNRDTSPTPFTDFTTDLGNMSVDEFFPIFKKSIIDSLKFLKPKGHIAVFMKDLQPTKDNPNLLHSRVIEDFARVDGLSYIGMKIWADQGANLYPYGYPYAFVSNQIHQYIIFFRRD